MLLNYKAAVLSYVLLLSACGGGEGKSAKIAKPTPVSSTATSIFDTNFSYQELLEKGVGEGITGISLYIETPTDTLTLTSGVSNITTNSPLRPEHLFRIASNTKSFVATIALQLSVQQQLDLSAPISDYLPTKISEQLTNSTLITVKQLLTHTSGLFDYLSNPDYWHKVAEYPQYDWSPEEMLSYAYQQAAVSSPGEAFDYSNSNYLILGLIIDDILGYDLAIEIRKKILEPLNMTETFYYQREEIDGELIHGYELEQGELVSYRHINLGYMAADGGMVSTPRDLAKFFKAFGKQQYPFKNGLFEQMIGQTNNIDKERAYGIGMIVQTEHGENEPRTGRYSYVHGGYNNGYITKSHYYPEEGVTIAYFINRSFYNNEEANKRVMFADLIHTIKNKVFSNL